MPARFQKCGEATFNYPYNNHSIGHDGRGIAVTIPWNLGHDAAESPVTMTWNTQNEKSLWEGVMAMLFLVPR